MKNHSASSALIEAVDSIYKQIDNNDITIGIYLDLQKAFDNVNHEILLAKMTSYEIIGMIYNCELSAKQTPVYCYRKNNSAMRNINEINCGVPKDPYLGASCS